MCLRTLFEEQQTRFIVNWLWATNVTDEDLSTTYLLREPFSTENIIVKERSASRPFHLDLWPIGSSKRVQSSRFETFRRRIVIVTTSFSLLLGTRSTFGQDKKLKLTESKWRIGIMTKGINVLKGVNANRSRIPFRIIEFDYYFS